MTATRAPSAGYVHGVETIGTFDDVVALAREYAPLYVRFSEGPAHDAQETSIDYEADVSLPGLAVSSLTPEPWWTRPDEDWVARRLCKYLDLQETDSDRRPWLLTGVVVGNGTDHEPLIGAVEPMGWVGPQAIEEAQRIYRERFSTVHEPDSPRRETGPAHGVSDNVTPDVPDHPRRSA